VPLGVTLRGSDTLPEALADVRHGAASEEAAGTAAVHGGLHPAAGRRV
jgi:hypothetical protein